MEVKWRKASRSTVNGENCVELADLAGNVGVRDSKDPHGPRLALPVESFRALVTEIKRGAHDSV